MGRGRFVYKCKMIGASWKLAMGIYGQILSEDKTDAEVYWFIVLC